MRLQLAARGGILPGAFTLGVLTSQIQRVAEAHGDTCHGIGCTTCAEIVGMLSTSAAFVIDNVTNLDEETDRVRNGDGRLPSEQDVIDTLTDKATQAVAQELRPTLWRLDVAELLLLGCGAVVGWAAARSSRPLAVAGLLLIPVAWGSGRRLVRLWRTR